MGCISSSNKELYALKKDIFNVSVVRVQPEDSVVLARLGNLDITAHHLIFTAPGHESVAWALQHLRRYGLTGDIFSFEAGRRCPTGHGIYTFRCCNADEFYAKFRRLINSSVVNDRNNSSAHSSNFFGRLDGYNRNHYLEPTFLQISAPVDEQTSLSGSTNDNNDFHINSYESLHSSSLTSEIINFPLYVPPYSNVIPNTHIATSNIYMEQPIRINNEHNNIAHEILEHSNVKSSATLFKSLMKSSSLDVPPKEYAPIVNVESQRLYENINSSTVKSVSSSQISCTDCAERYANIDFLPRLEGSQNKSFQLDISTGKQQGTLTKNAIVNYIILDLDQRLSSSMCSQKNYFSSDQSLSGITKKDLSSTVGSLSCGSFTMPKRTVSDTSAKLSNSKMGSSGSYTRIDFLKTFALMKSSTNCTDFDADNEQESRLTRHSKFVRKAYSISE